MKKITFALSTLSLAFALTACTTNTTKTNQVSPGTRIQSSTGIYNGTTGGTNLVRNRYGTTTYGTTNGINGAYPYGTNNGMTGRTYGTTNGTTGGAYSYGTNNGMTGRTYGTTNGTTGGAYSYGTNNGTTGGTSTYGINGTGRTNFTGNRYGTAIYGTPNYGATGYGTTNGLTGRTTTYGTTRNFNGTNTAQNLQMGTYKYSIYKPNTSGATTNQFRAYSRSEQPLVGVARVGNFGTSTRALSSANTTNQSVYVDRQMLANALAAVAKQYPSCKGVTVVTTDNQAFVGCDTRGLNSVQAKKVVDQIRSATSGVCPRYYKLYASNDQKVINNIYHASGTLSQKTDGEFEKLLGLRK